MGRNDLNEMGRTVTSSPDANHSLALPVRTQARKHTLDHMALLKQIPTLLTNITTTMCTTKHLFLTDWDWTWAHRRSHLVVMTCHHFAIGGTVGASHVPHVQATNVREPPTKRVQNTFKQSSLPRIFFMICDANHQRIRFSLQKTTGALLGLTDHIGTAPPTHNRQRTSLTKFYVSPAITSPSRLFEKNPEPMLVAQQCCQWNGSMAYQLAAGGMSSMRSIGQLLRSQKY